eukprot:scaffold119604_cov65-Phaeocystis_antarctica.AAC.6
MVGTCDSRRSYARKATSCTPTQPPLKAAFSESIARLLLSGDATSRRPSRRRWYDTGDARRRSPLRAAARCAGRRVAARRQACEARKKVFNDAQVSKLG